MGEKKYYVPQTSDWFRVRAASTAAVTLAGLDAGQVLDGVTLVEGDRVLLKNQADPVANGVYVIKADTVAPTRATDYPVGYKSDGSVVKVTEGTANARTAWLQYTEPGVVGTASLLYISHPTGV